VGLLSRAGDFTYTIRFLRLLTTKFEDTEAFKLGLIDNNGKKLRKPETSEEKSAYNYFHRLVFNLKKLLAKVPGGSSKFASYASALFLIKETLDLNDKSMEKVINECGLDPLDFLNENTQWFCTEDGMLSPGTYTLAESSFKVIGQSAAEGLVRSGDKVRVEMDNYPAGNMMGMDIYQVTHVPTNQNIYISAGEIRR
jgi:hypothetical protein